MLKMRSNHGTPAPNAFAAYRRSRRTRMPNSPLPTDVISLPETLTKFREHAQKGNYALAQRYHEQVRAELNQQISWYVGRRKLQAGLVKLTE